MRSLGILHFDPVDEAMVQSLSLSEPLWIIHPRVPLLIQTSIVQRPRACRAAVTEPGCVRGGSSGGGSEGPWLALAVGAYRYHGLQKKRSDREQHQQQPPASGGGGAWRPRRQGKPLCRMSCGRSPSPDRGAAERLGLEFQILGILQPQPRLSSSFRSRRRRRPHLPRRPALSWSGFHLDSKFPLSRWPTISPTLVLVNMYQRPDMITPGVDAQGQPIDPRKMQEHFEDFYEDIFEELSKFGEIENLNVCDNLADHMIGNVYVQFREEDQAAAAHTALQGRFYSGRPIVVDFSPVTDFREATCRQYEENSCNRGGYCNFMHVKKIVELGLLLLVCTGTTFVFVSPVLCLYGHLANGAVVRTVQQKSAVRLFEICECSRFRLLRYF
ncbi:hypothetical protein C2845_PM07G17260 [Panicum miliaceum]|uniref:Splicing factor U2af small subunit B-like n=1 Tax=Panicum miliaceum TaxID=4540 RepID=A0A3L6SU22_PANMI|nr:hypothetical protein C2845_PM07G17260 [Panicum miliaceum]